MVLIGTIGVCCLLIAIVFPRVVGAQALSHQQLDIDDSFVQPDQAYSVPTSIVVIPIFPPTTDFNLRDRDWFRGLYYYLTANDRRSGFTDIPFHYVVSKDGRIFAGNTGGEERKINISSLGDEQVVIGYLAGKSDNSFDPRAMDELGGLIIDVANKNSIKLTNVSVSGIRYIRNDTTQTVSLEKRDLYGLWNSSLNEIIDQVKHFYKPVSKEYKVKITKIALPITKVVPGKTVEGTLTLLNTGEFGIYSGTISDLVGTKRSGNSKFYLPGEWASTSQFYLVGVEEALLPGEEKDFKFKLNVPLYFGKQTEQFFLKNLTGYKLADTNFSLTLDVKRPSGTVVQVKQTETGWLRVRSAPSGAASEVTRISAGERYFQTKDSGNGWVKLKLGDGKSGWVSKAYLIYV